MSESKKDEIELSPFLRALIRGECDSFAVIVPETVRRLEKEMTEKGTDSFTIGDIRRIRNEIFGVKSS